MAPKGSEIPASENSRIAAASADASAVAVSASLGEGAVFEPAGKIEVVGNEIVERETKILVNVLIRRAVDRMHEALLDSLCQ